jgi:hypothetical protein
VRWRALLVAAGVGALAFGAITLVALEGVEVVELRTHDGAGAPRTTRVWIADADGASWIESATPDRPFLRDIVVDPTIEVVRGGRVLAMQATPEPGQAGHDRIRRLLADKYGWADVWIGLVADTSQSVIVRLDRRDLQEPRPPSHDG